MPPLIYSLAVLGLAAGLVVFSYLDRIFRELGRVSIGQIHANLDIFESDVEPRLGMGRRRANLTFSLLAHLWLVLVAVQAARGVSFFVPGTLQALLQHVFFLTSIVLLGMHLFPYILLTRTSSRWLLPLVPLIRAFVLLVWPLRALIEAVISVAHLTEAEEPGKSQAQQEGIEQLVEAAEEEGFLAREEAKLIEQVVEFTDKRVREVMTPRPYVVAIPEQATIEQLRRLLVETKYSRLPVYATSLDDILGIVYARDLLQVPDEEAAHRQVRELVRPALFVPETKLGSQMLKELQQKNQQLAIVIDEYGSMAGLVTAEDLVEEIVGEIGEEDRAPVPDVVREPDGSAVMRGSVAVERVQEIYGVTFDEPLRDTGVSTIAGLLNHVAGHVPRPGETIEAAALVFEVLEANQRKVLRVRVRPSSAARPAAAGDKSPRAADAT